MLPKIFVLPVPIELQPSKSPFLYPAHSSDWGVEQDFLAWLQRNPSQVAETARAADWHYLPVFWTRRHLWHNYGQDGLAEFGAAVRDSILDDQRTFTVCQYDDGPLVDIGDTVQALASRKGSEGIDIPLLCDAPKFMGRRRKKWKASFIGRVSTHKLRGDLALLLEGRPDVLFVDHQSGHDTARAGRRYRRVIASSEISIAPRGYGGSSFRFFESCALGTAPLMLSDIDTRPFQSQLPWRASSIFASSAAEAVHAMDTLAPQELELMGSRAGKLYRESLAYGKWCPLLVNEVASITPAG